MKEETRTEKEIEAIVEAIFQQPLFRFVGLRLLSREPGAAVCSMNTGAETHNAFGGVHGGAINAAVEGPAFVALLPYLKKSEHSVTVAINLTNLRALPRDTEIALRSRVLRKARKLAFVQTDVYVGDLIHVTAQLTKAIVKTPA